MQCIHPLSGHNRLYNLIICGLSGIVLLYLSLMPRKIVPVSMTNPYHISARCLNKEWFKIPLPYVWRVYSDYLFFIHHAYNVEIFSFVLMNNHFHLLAGFPEGNIGKSMNYFMRETSKVIGEMCGRINQLYGAPYHKCMIDTYHYYLHAYKYIYRNPVQAGLVKNVEEYPFSTLNGLLGQSKIWIPIEEDLTLFNDVEDTLKWLNRTYEKGHLDAVASALRHSVFSLPRDIHNQKEHELVSILS